METSPQGVGAPASSRQVRWCDNVPVGRTAALQPGMLLALGAARNGGGALRVASLVLAIAVGGWFLPAGAAAAQTTRDNPRALELGQADTVRESPHAAEVAIPAADGRPARLYGESHALLIAVSRYTAGWPSLESVPEEADKVREALVKQGFQVTRIDNPTCEQLKAAMEQFIDEYGFRPDNRLLVYFSGHGHTRRDGRKGYIVPADAPNPVDDEIAFARKAVEMEQIITWARRMESKHALFVFDSCFSGTVFKAKELPVPRQITYLTANPVRQFISAGGAGETVPARSVFTPSFIRGIGGEADLDGDGFVTGSELGSYLQRKVLSYGVGQTPQFGKIRDPDLDEGDIVFVPANRQEREAQAEAAYRKAESQDTEEAWQAVADAFGGTAYGRLAREKLFALEQARLAGEAGRQRQQQEAAAELRRQRQAAIQAAWESTRLADVAEAYRRFIGQYDPEPLAEAQVRQARVRLGELEAVSLPATTAPATAPAGGEAGGAAAGPPPPGVPAGQVVKDPVAGMDFVYIPPGEFLMGSPPAEVDRQSSEGPQHRVTISRGFWLGRFEVTQGQWRAVMQSNPSYFRALGKDHPVENVSFPDVQEYIRRLNEKAGRARYRLPTEAEWEYACRAGTNTVFYCGDSLSSKQANFDGTYPYGWVAEDVNLKRTTPVGQYPPNAWGLCDMHGNVWEWCQDHFDAYPDTDVTDPRGPATGTLRISRGGSWYSSGEFCRSARRNHCSDAIRERILGFRLAADGF